MFCRKKVGLVESGRQVQRNAVPLVRHSTEQHSVAQKNSSTL